MITAIRTLQGKLIFYFTEEPILGRNHSNVITSKSTLQIKGLFKDIREHTCEKPHNSNHYYKAFVQQYSLVRQQRTHFKEAIVNDDFVNQQTFVIHLTINIV